MLSLWSSKQAGATGSRGWGDWLVGSTLKVGTFRGDSEMKKKKVK